MAVHSASQERARLLVSFAVVTVLFAMMFKWLPDISVAWRDVWLGAFITTLFFEVGKAAIGFYIGKQGLESTYGAAASIVVVLIWVYYTSQIILMGAEVIAKRRAPPVSRTRRRSRSPARSSGRTILAK
jgi:membrane protein